MVLTLKAVALHRSPFQKITESASPQNFFLRERKRVVKLRRLSNVLDPAMGSEAPEGLIFVVNMSFEERTSKFAILVVYIKIFLTR